MSFTLNGNEIEQWDVNLIPDDSITPGKGGTERQKETLRY